MLRFVAVVLMSAGCGRIGFASVADASMTGCDADAGPCVDVDVDGGRDGMRR